MMKGLAVLALLLGGCNLYFGGDDDPPCYYGDDKATPTSGVALELRDPLTGACVYQGGYECDDRCGPCPLAVPPLPDWGQCYSSCEGLDEQACFVTPGCYAAYLDNPMSTTNSFWGCWQSAPSGPVQGACTNLDAYECSRHDNCIAVYEAAPNVTKFDYCAAEPSVDYCVDDTDCGGTGFCDTTVCYPSPTCTPCATCGACPDSNTCYGVCVPYEPHACEVIDCAPGYTCAEVCTPMNGCSATCVPNQQDPGVCYGLVQCNSPAPACPSGTTPGTKNGCYTGYCIPTSACGPSDPGQCNGTVTCNSQPPSCPSGTVPGIANGCWTGYCIPQSACPMAACPLLTTEAACMSRADCVPIYDGAQCTCGPNGCTCQVLTYDRCETM